jgi:hypothetical protein
MSVLGKPVTAYEAAERLMAVGIREIPGTRAHPYISWGLRIAGLGETPSDEIANCSAGLLPICVMLGLPRPMRPLLNPAAARSWLRVGEPVRPERLERGFDVVILSRGSGEQPGPDVLAAPGHVGLFSGWEGTGNPAMLNGARSVRLLGFNQGDALSIQAFDVVRILGGRRLA